MRAFAEAQGDRCVDKPGSPIDLRDLVAHALGSSAGPPRP